MARKPDSSRPGPSAPSGPSLTSPRGATFADLIRSHRILVCVGSGGVGKTTIAATLALTAAMMGRRTLVLTIDPARRLADSLGLKQLGHDIQRVPADVVAQVAQRRGPPPGGTDVLATPGILDAMMLDQKRAFDEIVARYAKDEGVRQRILDNRIYQQISAALAGSHEYAAMSKLYELSRDDRYDLIVLDTPPTENALDFLDAPEKVSQAIDSPAIQWFIKPYLSAGTFSLKLVGMGGAFVLRGIARFVGSAFLEQMAQFFVEFHQVLAGFRERARDVFQLMQQPQVAFVLCASPELLTVDEALYFHQRLRTAQMPLGGFVVNRVHEKGPDAPSRQQLVDLLMARPELQGFSPEDVVQVASDLDRTYREQQVLSLADAASVQKLRAAADLSLAPLCTIPIFEQDIYGVEGLALVSKHLVA